MENVELFWKVFLASILGMRVWLYIVPLASPTIRGFRLHHYQYGMVLMPVGVYLQDIGLFAIGLALFSDEVPLLLLGGQTHEDNYATASVLGVALLASGIVALREPIVATVMSLG